MLASRIARLNTTIYDSRWQIKGNKGGIDVGIPGSSKGTTENEHTRPLNSYGLTVRHMVLGLFSRSHGQVKYLTGNLTVNSQYGTWSHSQAESGLINIVIKGTYLLCCCLVLH